MEVKAGIAACCPFSQPQSSAGDFPQPCLRRAGLQQGSHQEKRREGANKKFYHKETLVAPFQAQGNIPLPRKLLLDLALGKLTCRWHKGAQRPEVSVFPGVAPVQAGFSPLMFYTRLTCTTFSRELAFSSLLVLTCPRCPCSPHRGSRLFLMPAPARPALCSLGQGASGMSHLSVVNMASPGREIGPTWMRCPRVGPRGCFTSAQLTRGAAGNGGFPKASTALLGSTFGRQLPRHGCLDQQMQLRAV